MSALRKIMGRLLGGLSRVRALLGARRDAIEHLAWSLAGGVIGCAVGLLGVTLWLRYQ